MLAMCTQALVGDSRRPPVFTELNIVRRSQPNKQIYLGAYGPIERRSHASLKACAASLHKILLRRHRYRGWRTSFFLSALGADRSTFCAAKPHRLIFAASPRSFWGARRSERRTLLCAMGDFFISMQIALFMWRKLQTH